MPLIDLHYCDPESLAEDVSLEDLLETVRSIEKWTNRQAEVLDYIYCFRTQQIIRERDKAKEIEELYLHLSKTTHPLRKNKLDELNSKWAERWHAYADLLEIRLAFLQGQTPKEILKRKYFSEILQMVVKNKVLSRKELVKNLSNPFISPQNLTRVIKIMEASELIEVNKKGREDWFAPGIIGERLYKEQRGETHSEKGKGDESGLNLSLLLSPHNKRAA